MKFARKRDESASDVAGHGMVTRYLINTVEVPQISTSTEKRTFQLCVEDGDEKLVCVPECGVFYSPERLVCVFLKLVTPELSRFHGWIGNRDSEGEVGIEIAGCCGWNTCQMAVKRNSQGWDPSTHEERAWPTAGGQVMKCC